MESEPALCPNCRGRIFESTKICPWCGWQLVADPAAKPINPALQPTSSPVRSRDRIYKVTIAVLLIATAASSALLVNYAVFHFGGEGLPTVSYAIASMDESTNWSGYAVNGSIGLVYDVQASMKVPHFTCPTSGAAAAFWVGIDGRGSSTVEQVGVIADCTLGHSGFYTFWEWYPTRAYTRGGASARENDTLNLEVKFDGNEFIGTINDATQGWTYTDTNTTIVPSAQRLSAEWIAEAPLTNGAIVPLANFGRVFFSNCRATIGSRTGSLDSFPLTQITMIDTSKMAKADPILPVVGDGASFSVWWIRSGP